MAGKTFLLCGCTPPDQLLIIVRTAVTRPISWSFLADRLLLLLGSRNVQKSRPANCLVKLLEINHLEEVHGLLLAEPVDQLIGQQFVIGLRGSTLSANFGFGGAKLCKFSHHHWQAINDSTKAT